MPLTDHSNTYCSNISNKLTFLTMKVHIENKVNITDLNIRAEEFYVEFLNGLFDWKLKNANAENQNTAGIDLIDECNKIIVQVSSSFDHGKIQRSLDKSNTEEYADYRFRFVAITPEAKNYQKFNIPDELTFNAKTDVLNTSALLRHVLNAGIEKQKALSELVDKYFGSDLLPIKGQCLTETPGYADTSSVICRETELEAITKMLQEKKSILLMSGFGGIGKTALARLVFHTVRENYDQVAWIPYSKNLKESMLRTIEGLNGNNPEERWDEIQRILNNGASKLIVIDNADQDDSANQLPHKDDDLIALTGRPNVTIIVTSRRNMLPSFTTYPVGFMDEDKCVALFYCYYDSPQRAEDEPVVRKLIQMAGCHTFTVELLAKGANCEDSLEEYYQDLKKEGFSFPDIEVDTAHNGATTTIANHLKILFDRKTRTAVQMELLYDFSVLPAAATLNKREIKAWFGIDVNTCEQLVKDGWLLRNNGRYAMHPLVKEILHLDPIPENTAEKFLAFIENKDNHFFLEDEVYVEQDRKLAFAEAVVTEICHENTIQLAHLLDNIGEAYWRAGQYPRAEEHFIHAITIKEGKLGRENTDIATTYNNIAVVYYAKGELDKAIKFFEKALIIREAKLEKDHKDVATTYSNIAAVYEELGSFDRALKFNEEAKNRREAKLGEEHPDTAVTYNNIALVYQHMGEINKALEFYEKAMNIREAKLGEDHPDTAITYNNIATAYHEIDNLDKALEFYKKALVIQEAKLGKDHPHTAAIYNNIAVVYHSMEDHDKALRFYEKALEIHEAKLGNDHPEIAFTYHNMGAVYYCREIYSTARDYFLQALRIRLRKLVNGHPYVKDTMDWLSDCHEAEGNAPEAFDSWLMGQLDEEERKILFAHRQGAHK